MIEILVQLVPSKKFKVTITSDHNMRIKVPIMASQEDLLIWKDKCCEILILLKKEDIPFTLRGHVSDPNKDRIHLHSEHSKKIKVTRFVFETFNDKLIMEKKSILPTPKEIEWNEPIIYCPYIPKGIGTKVETLTGEK